MNRVTEFYEYLHTIPEEGFLEVKTSAFLADQLETMGYQVSRNLAGKTGVLGVYDTGVEGPVVAIRADMDALGHVIDGVRCSRHTCGHDAHSSVVLAAAEELIRSKLIKKGKLKVIFQPAEEIGTGALSVLEAGVMDDVEYIFGSHLRPSEEASFGQISPAIHYASSSQVTVVFHGKPAHGARPHLGINAIDAATAAIMAVNAIHLRPSDSYSAKATRFICDVGVTNAIPDEATVTWDLRAQFNPTMDELRAKFFSAIEAGAATVGASMEIKGDKTIPAAELDEEATQIVKEAIIEVVGENGLTEPVYTPGGEDFFFYTRQKPSLKAGFFGLGCDLEPGLHHPDMHFNLESLPYGVAVFKNIVLRILG